MKKYRYKALAAIVALTTMLAVAGCTVSGSVNQSSASVTPETPTTPTTPTTPGSGADLVAKLSVSSSQNFNIPENSLSYFVLILDKKLPSSANISWAINADGPDLPSDYFTATSGTITIPANDQSFMVQLPIKDNARYEGTRSFKWVFTSMSPSINATQAEITFSLIDDEPVPTVAFSTAHRTVNEADGAISVTVEMSPASAQSVTANYDLSGTATLDTDYTATSSHSVTFAPGETSKTINLSITDDTDLEPTEDLKLTLTSATLSPSGVSATIGTIPEEQIELQDNDGSLLVSVDQKLAQADPANATPIDFEALFSSPINVSTFSAADIEQNGTATVNSWSIVNSGNDRTFTLRATSVSGDGTVAISIKSGGVSTTGGATNLASTSADASVTYDVTPPSVPSAWALSSPSSGATTNDPTPVISATGLSSEDGGIAYAYDNSTCTNLVGSAQISSGSFTINTIQYAADGSADGLKSFYGRLKDVAGNMSIGCTDLSLAYTLQMIVPKVSVTIARAGAQATSTNSLPVVFDVAFSEAIDPLTFTLGDIGNDGTSFGITWQITNSGDDKNFSLLATAMTSPGTIIPKIAADAVQTLSGKKNTAATGNDRTVEYQLPPAALSISPTSITMRPGGRWQFTSSGGASSHTFSRTSGAGSVTASGLYTAPTTIGTTSQITVTDSALATANASVTVNGVNTYTMCSSATINVSQEAFGVIVDSGGESGNYGNSQKCYLRITGDPGVPLKLHFESFGSESTHDVLTVYDGLSTSGTQLGAFSGSSIPADLTATTGSFYIYWTSDASVVGTGFKATWSTQITDLTLAVLPSVATVSEALKFDALAGVGPFTFTKLFGNASLDAIVSNVYAKTFSAPADMSWEKVRVTDSANGQVEKEILVGRELRMCQTTESSMAWGVLYDSGGASGAYSNSETCSFTIGPFPAGTTLELWVDSLDTEATRDLLKIYDGTSTAAPLLASLSGYKGRTAYTPTGTSALVTFTSDASITNSGFRFSWRATLPSFRLAELTTSRQSYFIEANTPTELLAWAGTLPFSMSKLQGAGTFTVNASSNVLGTYLTSSLMDHAIFSATDGASGSSSAEIFTSSANTICNDAASGAPWGILYDDGGRVGNYSNSRDCTFMINPGIGPTTIKLLVDGVTELNNDYLEVYEGAVAGGTKLATLSGTFIAQEFTTTSGIASLRFRTDGSIVKKGFKLTWQAQPASFAIMPALQVVPGNAVASVGVRGGTASYSFTSNGSGSFDTGGAAATYTAPATEEIVTITAQDGSGSTAQAKIFVAQAANIMCTQTSSTSMAGFLYDSGGPNGNYAAVANCGFLIQPSAGAGPIIIQIDEFDTEAGYDQLKIYDGVNASAPLLATYSGVITSQKVTASTGNVFLKFTSDTSGQKTGFRLKWYPAP